MQKTEDGLGYISTSDESRETLGTQLIRQAQKDQPKQQVGETMSEIEKLICRELEIAINNARDKGIRGRIYIFIVPTNFGPKLNQPCSKLTFFTRETRPTPEWDTCLYSHDEGDNTPTFQWSLPAIGDHKEILRNPHRYTPDQIKWVKQMLQGTLV